MKRLLLLVFLAMPAIAEDTFWLEQEMAKNARDQQAATERQTAAIEAQTREMARQQRLTRNAMPEAVTGTVIERDDPYQSCDIHPVVGADDKPLMSKGPDGRWHRQAYLFCPWDKTTN